MTIKEQLNNIKKKYHLDDDIKDLFVNRELADIWYRNTKKIGEKQVIIFGAGGNTKILLRLLICWREIKKIKYIYDSHSKVSNLFGIPVFNSLNFDEDKNSLIWISSYRYRKEMKEYLIKNNCKIHYIDPYEILSKHIPGTEKKDIFFQTGAMRSLWFSERLKNRDSAISEDERKKITRELIAGYFCIYDWVYFFKEVDDYIDIYHEDSLFYLNLKCEVSNILNNLEKQISDKKDNIIIFMIDCLSKQVADKMVNLKKWKKNALEFLEYRCEYPGTREVLASLMTGWRPFEDKTYAGRKIEFSDSDILKYIYENNIKIKYLSDDYIEMIDYEKINQYRTKTEENALLSEVFFNGLCELAMSEERQIIIMHCDTTIHYPHMIPTIKYYDYKKLNNPKKAYKEMFKKVSIYTDEILGFYLNILGKNSDNTQIVMGDHGIDVDMEFDSMIIPKERNSGIRWNGKVFNTALIIKKGGVSISKNTDLISSNQFCKIFYNILLNNALLNNIKMYKSLPIEWVPGWNPDYIQKGFNGNNYYFGIGACGCMNKKYMFIETEDGEEFYYIYLEDKLKRIYDEKKIQIAKKSLGIDEINSNKFPINLMNQEFFESHNRIYNEFRLKKNRNYK